MSSSSEKNSDPSADKIEPIYFKVTHSGGLVVRSDSNLTAESTGRVIACDSIITSKREPLRDGDNVFIEISEGGWVVAQKGNLQACVRINGPIVTSGEWLYEVVHPSGTRFAKSSNIAEASERNEMLHVKGSTIKAICKKTDLGSIITTVQLDNNYGWIFEHSATGQVLDRLGNELVVIPVDEYREMRDFWAKVVAVDGVNILTTPTETSVSKERLEKDKTFQSSEVLNVPIHAAEGSSGGAAIGATRYYRLKDGRGWVIAMRKSLEDEEESKEPSEAADGKEKDSDKNRGVSFVDVIEIPAPPASAPAPAASAPQQQPSSSSSSASQGSSRVTQTSSSTSLTTTSSSSAPTAAAASASSQSLAQSQSQSVPTNGNSGGLPLPMSREQIGLALAQAQLQAQGPGQGQGQGQSGGGSQGIPLSLASMGIPMTHPLAAFPQFAGGPNGGMGAAPLPSRILEDVPYSSWYRVVYKGGIRLRRSPSMSDVMDNTLPVGCWVKTCRRVTLQLGLKRERERDRDPLGDTTALSGEAAGRSTVVFLQLVACVGARVRVADSWIFERAPESTIVAAEEVPEPRVESPPGLVLMVLYPGGITLRESPHMSANKTEHVVKMYECHSAQGMISTADGLESFALLSGGAWLPCKAPGGLEVAVRVPRMPTSRAGFFEVTMKRDCPTLYGPFPDTPSLPHVLPKGVVLPFDLLLWYPTSSGTVSASDIFLRLQQNDMQSQAPAIWIRRDDDAVSIIERTPTL